MDDKKALKAAGCPDHEIDKALELKPRLEAKGFDWLTVLSLLQQYGPVVFEIIQKLLAGGATPTAKAPPA